MGRFVKYRKEKNFSQIVGAKGAAIHEMRQLGLNVPQTVWLTTEAVKELGANFQMQHDSSALAGELLQELQELCDFFKKQNIALLAVRSSALVEDGKAYSFAGQFHTELEVPCQRDALLRALQKVGASYGRVADSPYVKGPIGQSMMGVIVQEMIIPQFAGVVFSAHPLTGDEQVIVLEYVEGSGKQLVDGSATPVQLTFSKKDLRVSHNEKIPPALLEQLLSGVLKLEKHYSYPVDVEWAAKENKVYFLQVRPVTVLGQRGTDEIVWTNENVGEVIPDVVTPLSWSFLGPVTNSAFHSVLKSLNLPLKNDAQLFTLYKGRVYFNRTLFLGLLEQLSFREQLKSGLIAQPFNVGGENVWRIIKVAFSFLRMLKHYGALQPAQFSPHQPLSDKEKSIQKLWQQEKEIMAVHVAVTILGEVFFQVLRAFLKKNSKMGAFNAEDILQGYQQIASTRAVEILWELSRHIKKRTMLAEIIQSTDDITVLEQKLSESAQGRNLLFRINQFLDQFGHGALHEFELLFPRWAEDRSYIYNTLKTYLQLTDQANPLQQRLQLEHKREQTIAQISNQLSWPFRKSFRYLVSKTLHFSQLRELYKQRFLQVHYVLKKELIHIADKWLEKGWLTARDDIFYLTVEEIFQILKTGAMPAALTKQIAARQDERGENLKYPHPEVVKQRGDQWIEVKGARMGHQKQWLGIPCSGGEVVGTVRVVHKAETCTDFQKGEILVTRSTNPGWTPLFLLAGGIITEIGGALSHAAIIAREFGIPMVAGVKDITQLVHNGDRVRLKGGEGTVEILSEEESH